MADLLLSPPSSPPLQSADDSDRGRHRTREEEEEFVASKMHEMRVSSSSKKRPEKTSPRPKSRLELDPAAYAPLLEPQTTQTINRSQTPVSSPSSKTADVSISPEKRDLVKLNKLHSSSGTKFYGRVRLVIAEELIYADESDKAAFRRKQIALSRRGQKLARKQEQHHMPQRAKTQMTRNRSMKSSSSRKTSGRYSQSARGDSTGNNDTYDAYPWSAYYRDQVMCLSKIPRPPYFSQLNSGLRPDTIVLRTIPVKWFLDTPEEVAAERERELRERKVARFEGDKESGEPTSDSPLWFTKHGHIIVKAACMRFGPVRRVDLIFEMDSRDQEWTLMFDAYVQFSTFAGFRDAYIAFDGGIFVHDEDMSCMELEPEFDTTGYFSDKKVKLRKVRKEMAQRKEEEEEHARKVKLRKMRRNYRDDVENVQKAVKTMKNQFEDLEYELDNLLQLRRVQPLGSASLTKAQDMEDAQLVQHVDRARRFKESALHFVECMPERMPDPEERLRAKEAARAEGKNEVLDFKESGMETETNERDDEGPPRSCSGSEGDNEKSSPLAREKILAARLIAMMTGDEILYEAKKRLSCAKKSMKEASGIVFKAYTIRTVQVPTLMKVLEDKSRTHSRLMELVHRRIRTHGEGFFHGVTLFVPHDRSFGSDTHFDEDCWGTHIIHGPYLARDLYGFASEGKGELLCANGVHHLSVGINELGEFTVWIDRKGHPRRVVRIEESDVFTQNGTVVHFVDKVIFPPAY